MLGSGLRAEPMVSNIGRKDLPKKVYVTEYIEVMGKDGGKRCQDVTWTLYVDPESAESAIDSYWRGRGMTTLDAEIMADAIMDRCFDDFKRYETHLNEVRIRVIKLLNEKVEVVSGMFEADWYDYPVYFWIDDDGEICVQFTTH